MKPAANETQITDLSAITSQFTGLNPADGLPQTILLPSNIVSATITWADPTAPDYNQSRSFSLQLIPAEGYSWGTDISLPAGWNWAAAENVLTLNGIAQFRKMKAKLAELPEDQDISKYCYTASQALDASSLLYTLPLQTEDGSVSLVNIDYTCENFSSVPRAVNEFSWEAQIENVDQYEMQTPVSGTVRLTNPYPLSVEARSWDQSGTYGGGAFDIKTMFSFDSNAGPIEYYLIEEGKDPQLIPNGIFLAPRVGDLLIEARSKPHGFYGEAVAQATLTVSKGDGSMRVGADIEGWIFGSEPKTPQIWIYWLDYDMDAVEIQYRTLEGQTIIPSKTLDAGEYEVVIHFMETELYNAVEKVLNFVVEKADPQWVSQGNTTISAGSEDVQIPGHFVTDGAVSFHSDNPQVIQVDSQGKIKALKAGRAIITVTAEEGKNYKAATRNVELEAVRQERTWTAEEQVSLEFGSPDFVISHNTEEMDQEQITISGDALSLVDGKFRINKAGIAEVTFNYPETEVYNTLSRTITVTVTPKTIRIVPDELTKVYGQPDPELTWSAEGIQDLSVLAGITLSREPGENAGSYAISASNTDVNPNYLIEMDQKKFTIEPMEASLIWDHTPLVYNGQNQKPACRIGNLIGKDQAEVTVEGGQKNAGNNYTATASALSNPNYRLPETGRQSSFAIAPKPAAIECRETKTYGDADPAWTFTVTGMAEGDSAGKIDITRTANEHVGQYILSLAETSELNSNYSFTFTGELVIVPKPVRVQWDSQKLVYSGTAQAPAYTLEGVLDGDDCQGSLTGSQIHAGSGYTAVLEGLNNPDYVLDGNTASTEFEIEPAPAVLHIDDQKKVYGQEDPNFTWTAGSLLDSDQPGTVILTRSEGESAGGYEITVDENSELNPDYRFEIEKGKLTIEPAPLENLEIILKDLIREDGSLKTQTIEDLEGLTEEDYKLSGHQNSAGGAYTLTLEGTGNYAGSFTHSYVVLPKNPGSFSRTDTGDAQIGQGSMSLNFKQDANVPASSLISQHEDLLNLVADNGLISASDLARVADGDSVSMTVSLQAAPAAADVLASVPSLWTSGAFAVHVDHPFGHSEALKGTVLLSVNIPHEALNVTQQRGSVPARVNVMVYRIDSGTPVPVECQLSADGQSLLFNAEINGTYILSSYNPDDIGTAIEPKPDPEPQPDEPAGDDSSKNAEMPEQASTPSKSSESKQEPKKFSKSESPKTAAAENLSLSLGTALIAFLSMLFLWRKDRSND